MSSEVNKQIWTIGHSTRSAEEFARLLNAYRIEVLADIRNFPGSRKFPHFNADALEKIMAGAGIEYRHFKELGGRRKPVPGSRNNGWRVEAFRGYADYMETEPFHNAVTELMQLASAQRVAYMCSEAVWWSCHRALVSDYLKYRGWTVMHIMSPVKADEHPYTKPARIVGGELLYSEPGLFSPDS